MAKVAAKAPSPAADAASTTKTSTNSGESFLSEKLQPIINCCNLAADDWMDEMLADIEQPTHTSSASPVQELNAYLDGKLVP